MDIVDAQLHLDQQARPDNGHQQDDRAALLMANRAHLRLNRVIVKDDKIGCFTRSCGEYAFKIDGAREFLVARVLIFLWRRRYGLRHYFV